MKSQSHGMSLCDILLRTSNVLLRLYFYIINVIEHYGLDSPSFVEFKVLIGLFDLKDC